jgi:hypothetical protein
MSLYFGIERTERGEEYRVRRRMERMYETFWFVFYGRVRIGRILLTSS